MVTIPHNHSNIRLDFGLSPITMEIMIDCFLSCQEFFSAYDKL